MGLRVLLVFPESKYKGEIIYNFSDDENYDIVVCNTIGQALEKVNTNVFDIVLMDMNFQDGTGLDLKKRMNEIRDIPTIFVTTVRDDIQKVLALEYGADDYIVYPFNILELKARIRAVIRRLNQYHPSGDELDKDNIITYDDFEFNIVGRKVRKDGVDIDLTGKEFDLLFIFVSNPCAVFSREKLAEEIWGESYDGHLRTVDVHIRRLREKIGDTESTVIKTKWGEGYYFGDLNEDE